VNSHPNLSVNSVNSVLISGGEPMAVTPSMTEATSHPNLSVNSVNSVLSSSGEPMAVTPSMTESE
jgi:pyruvate-formate lyase-activating enzyme